MKFSISAKDPHSSARCGTLETAHGAVRTPIFMPVGTVGSVKGVYHRDLKEDIKAEPSWSTAWYIFAAYALVVGILFMIVFKDPDKHKIQA